MKSAKENARRIRAGAWLLLIAAVATGSAIVMQTIGPFLSLQYPRTLIEGAIAALLIFVAFLAAGIGAWMVFTGVADELEAST